jgi:hypothetical protein
VDRLRDAARNRKIEFLGAGARVVLESELNAGIRKTSSKNLVLFSAFGPLLVDLRRRYRGEPMVVLSDKHGSRNYYAPLLGRLFKNARLKVLEQGASCSKYSASTAHGPLTISFEPKAEARSLPVALASMICKYLRELFMDRLNAFFLERLPGLHPTAGYPEDAARFLRDLSPLLPEIPRDHLVRMK